MSAPERMNRLIEASAEPIAPPKLEVVSTEGGTPNGDVSWESPESLRKGSSAWVALWLFVPLLACLVYGYLTR